MTVQYGMAGYFREFDHPLEPDHRLQFDLSEEAPPFDPEAAPKLNPAEWTADRLQKANRNFAMDFVKTSLPELAIVLGPGKAGFLGNLAGQQIGRQFYRKMQKLLDHSGSGAQDFGKFLAAMAAAQDDPCDVSSDGDVTIVRQFGWRLMRGCGKVHPIVFEAWNGLWQGCLAVHNRFLILDALKRLDYGDDCFEWRIRKRGAKSF
jgi:hypothetical protein